MPELLGGVPLLPPTPDAPYHRVAAEGAQLPRTLLAILASVLFYLTLAPLLLQLFLGLAWTALGRPGGDFATWSLAGAAFQHPWGLAATHLAIAVLIVISALGLFLGFRRHPRWLLGVAGRLRWGYLLACLGASAVAVLGLWAISRAPQGFLPNPQADFAGFALAIVVTSPLQAAAEEIYFRGFLQQALGTMVANRWFAILGSALIFALFHGAQNVPLFLGRLAFGVLAGWLAIRTGGLEAGIAAHVVNNLAAFLLAGLYGNIAELKATQQVGWFESAWDVGGFALCALLSALLAVRFRLRRATPGLSAVGTIR